MKIHQLITLVLGNKSNEKILDQAENSKTCLSKNEWFRTAIDLFRTLLNITDGAFCKDSQWFLALHFFDKKFPS